MNVKRFISILIPAIVVGAFALNFFYKESTPADWKTYRDANYEYQISFPDKRYVSSYVHTPSEDGKTFSIPDPKPDSDRGADDVIMWVAVDEKPTSNCYDLELGEKALGKVKINGTDFDHVYYNKKTLYREWKEVEITRLSYRTVRNNYCYEINLQINSWHENFYNKETFNRMGEILNTFKFTK